MPSPSPLGRLRSRITTPHLREVDPDVRGFYSWAEGPSIVEPVGQSFLTGFKIAMEQPGPVGTMRALQDLPAQWQGFAAEGAAMATVIRDQVTPGGANFHKLVSISGGRHTYLMHVGLGWALARLPQPLWPNLSEYDPAVAPLILDGYGFHEVFFHTEQTLKSRRIEFPTRRWPGPHDHALQQLHQGVGRGLWFVAGGSAHLLKDLICSFSPEYHSAMWAGVGLAATYAGGRGSAGLLSLLDVAGEHAHWVRQGSTFAVEARSRADTVTEHTSRAAAALCNSTVDDLLELASSLRPSAQVTDSGDWTAYEVWRARIADSHRVLAATP